MDETPGIPKEMGRELRAARERFLDLVEGSRADLFAYCRRLTGDPWDAEDLVQEALLRAFQALSRRSHLKPIENARAYLFRIAGNAFLDRERRAGREAPLPEPGHEPAAEPPPATPEVRDALAALADRLGARERAAFLLADVFGFTAAEAAAHLDATPGAVKAALHRARIKLAELRETPERRSAVRRNAAGDALLDRFVKAFNDRDLDGIMALFAEDARAEIKGCLDEDDRDVIRDGSMKHTILDFATGAPLPEGDPGAEVVEIDGERIVALWYRGPDGRPALGDLLRFDVAGGRIRRLVYYYFSPELLAETAALFGVPARPNGYRWTPPAG